ncbi:MAG: enoyl-CoA hydratase/isomerase family protein [Deltaproteobacteria bacterium]|nr:enoyl-CoA hydratase/isomerase family protein [Deltaproteobacteria bacterium]
MANTPKESTFPLLVQQDGAVITITINDAPWNRMSLEFMNELEIWVEKLAEDTSVRAVVITSAGEENFSVGMHLKQLAGSVKTRGDMEAILDQRLRVLAAIENMEKPWVVTLFGYCLGGGLELPLACHFRLAAAEGAKIGLPELDIGAIPAWGGTARLTRCVGRMHALDMILRVKHISGPEAYRIGLVNEVWPNSELKRKAYELAKQLSEMPAGSVAGVLRCVVGAGERSLQESLYEERQAVLRNRGSKDQMEGMMAFIEKRKPRFNRE